MGSIAGAPCELLADLHMELSSFRASAAARPGWAKCRATWQPPFCDLQWTIGQESRRNGAGDAALAVSMRRAAELQRVRFGSASSGSLAWNWARTSDQNKE